MSWKDILRNSLTGAAAAFVQGETIPGATLKNSGIFAGIGALNGFLQGITTHPAVMASTNVVSNLSSNQKTPE